MPGAERKRAARYLGGDPVTSPGDASALQEIATGSCDTILLNRFCESDAADAAVPCDPFEQTLHQCRRILRPGGLFLLTLNNPTSVTNIAAALRGGSWFTMLTIFRRKNKDYQSQH